MSLPTCLWATMYDVHCINNKIEKKKTIQTICYFPKRKILPSAINYPRAHAHKIIDYDVT